MADFAFNVSKGRAVEFAARVDSNDPANSAFVWVAINTSADDATLEDLDTLAAVLADGDTAEVANTGYSRIVVTDSDLSTPAPDDTNNRFPVDLPDPDFGEITDDDVDWTDLLLCYDPDTTSGTDANIIPVCQYDCEVTIDGSNITPTVHTDGAFRAS